MKINLSICEWPNEQYISSEKYLGPRWERAGNNSDSGKLWPDIMIKNKKFCFRIIMNNTGFSDCPCMTTKVSNVMEANSYRSLLSEG